MSYRRDDGDRCVVGRKRSEGPPALWDWWRVGCWTVFWAGIVDLLFAMTVVALFGSEMGSWWTASCVVVPVAWFSLPLAGVNTWLAADGFGRRSREIEGVIRGALREIYGTSVNSRAERDEGNMVVVVDRADKRVDDRRDAYTIVAKGGYLPYPYTLIGEPAEIHCSLSVYLGLLREEVGVSRRAAGRLGAAMGVLFVAASGVIGSCGQVIGQSLFGGGR